MRRQPASTVKRAKLRKPEAPCAVSRYLFRNVRHIRVTWLNEVVSKHLTLCFALVNGSQSRCYSQINMFRRARVCRLRDCAASRALRLARRRGGPKFHGRSCERRPRKIREQGCDGRSWPDRCPWRIASRFVSTLLRGPKRWWS